MKGQTIPCAYCRDVLIRYVTFPSGTGELFCAHCGELNKIIITTEIIIKAEKVDTHLRAKNVIVPLIFIVLFTALALSPFIDPKTHEYFAKLANALFQ